VSTSLCPDIVSLAGALKHERLVLVSFLVAASIVNTLSYASISVENVGSGPLPRRDTSRRIQ
jgi:hypothetical protein